MRDKNIKEGYTLSHGIMYDVNDIIFTYADETKGCNSNNYKYKRYWYVKVIMTLLISKSRKHFYLSLLDNIGQLCYVLRS